MGKKNVKSAKSKKRSRGRRGQYLMFSFEGSFKNSTKAITAEDLGIDTARAIRISNVHIELVSDSNTVVFADILGVETDSGSTNVSNFSNKSPPKIIGPGFYHSINLNNKSQIFEQLNSSAIVCKIVSSNAAANITFCGRVKVLFTNDIPTVIS